MIRASLACACSTALLLSMSSAYAQQRHHEAHVHGQGQLNVAIDNTTLQMELKLPAQDVLGFEKITTDAQRSSLSKALTSLESDTLWILPEKASCMLTYAKASTSQDGHDEHAHSNHDHHDDHGHHAHHDAGHMDISVNYIYQCKNPEALNSLQTTLFQRFEGSKTVAVQSLTPKGQRSGKLTPAKRETEI